MRMVHLVCVSLVEDEVLWFWHGAPWGATICSFHQGIRWSFCFSVVLVLRSSAIPDLASPSKYGPYLSLIGRTFGVSSF